MYIGPGWNLQSENKSICRGNATFAHVIKFCHNEMVLTHISMSTASAMGSCRRTSTRLQAKSNDAAHRECLKQHDSDNAKRGQPHKCQAQGCTKSTVHWGSLCAVHKGETEIDKNLMPLIYQACPQFIPQNKNQMGSSSLYNHRLDRIQSRVSLWTQPPQISISRNCFR